MNPDNERDEWLMAQTAAGKRDSLEPLVRRHATPLLTFLHRMTGDRHRSEELLQEVFLIVWKKRGQYQFPRPFRPWLFAIALNKCRAAFRVRVPSLISLEGQAAPQPAAPEASPLEAAISTETATTVTRAVTQLPPLQRAVVVLRIWDGRSYAEIGETLGRTESTVRAHMFHGLANLRKSLEPRLS